MRLALALAAAIPFAAMSQACPRVVDPLSWKGKLRYHAEGTYSPMAIVGFAAYAGVLQALDAPRMGKGRRRIRQAFRFHGCLVGNPQHSRVWSRYHTAPGSSLLPLGPGGWRRVGHSLRGTILTRTDSGGETLSTWRLGSAYGAAFLSNQWYPDRLNTVRLGMIQGSMTLGFDFVGNLGSEFWPDIKRKVFGKK